MICFFCHRPIRGSELLRRCEWRCQDGQIAHTKVFGDGAPDGKLREAKGQLVKLTHGKCFHAWKKQLELAEAKAADPSSQPRPDTDWRPQDVIDVEDLIPGHESDTDNRGA